MIVASALIVWKSLMLISGSESPIVVVLSGSMEPAIYRGDLVFLTLLEKVMTFYCRSYCFVMVFGRFLGEDQSRRHHCLPITEKRDTHSP